MDNGTRSLPRRQVLAAVGTGTAGLVAGCAGASDDGGDGATPRAERLSPPVMGDPDAAVTLAVFEDYACPHCADYNTEGFPELEERYVAPGEIRYEHRDLPIPVAEPGSFQAANAARAVQDRHGDGAFWAYAEALFERSGDIPGEAPALFATIADEQGHDGDAIREAAVERVYERTVQSDREEAVEIGVEATPAFVLNGEVVASGFGSETVEDISAALADALSETG